jgi:hypothetical protein
MDMNQQNTNNNQKIITKMPNGIDFMINLPQGNLVITRAQLVKMLGQIPVTLLPNRH